MTEVIHRYTAWDAKYYDSKSRMWPHDHEVHGPFFAASEDGLKFQLHRAGLNPADVRWEITEAPSPSLPSTDRRSPRFPDAISPEPPENAQ